MSAQIAPETNQSSSPNPVTLKDLQTYFSETLPLESTDAAAHQAIYARLVASKQDIRAELGKLKKVQLERMVGFSRAETKPQLIDSVWRHMLQDFALSDSISFGFRDKWEDVIAGYVAKVTDERVNEYRRERIERREQAAAKKIETDQAVSSPQSLADFEICIRKRGVAKHVADQVPIPKKQYDVDVLIRKTGMAELTEEELEHFDELKAAEASGKRAEKMIDKATVKRIEIGDGNYMEVLKWWHSKRECDTWLVVLAEREDRTTFEELCIAARKLGGNYSRAWEERPGGFQFFSEEQALKFVEVQSKDVFDISRLEKLVANRERVRGNAIEHFGGLAGRMEDRANESLTALRELNTERRIMQAENAKDRANEDLAMAGTLRNYALALQQRITRHTDRIRWRTHAECLEEILSRAQGEIRKVSYPWPAVGAHLISDIAEEIGSKDGSILISRRMLKLVQEATDHVVEFDGDHRADTLRHFYRRARLHRTSRWTLDRVRDALGNFKRLRLMNIDTLPELRAALREHKGHRVEVAEMTKAEKVMRDLYPGEFPPDYFPTPPDVVELMLAYADIQPGMRCLEPSAGSGHIVNVAFDVQPEAYWELVELSGMLHKTLVAQGFTNAVHGDFLKIKPEDNGDYERVIMNPPFGCDGIGTDIDHVRHAFTFLKPGGRLVSVMSDGVFYRGDSKATEFRAWLEHVGGFDFELPEGAFLNSDRPTSWATRIVVIDKGE